ncbi:phospholipase/carboxylesterase [Agromyces flavus]|uniref:Phospholipase/carboxylesterase n=1 Tax=Agromyces flavus TaxID=589382 RepID=A0A1H1LHX1_9MICO|nr:alpha/beta fold hydrolase [Agromyces flavus]MCP2368518.1 phospholipase/carboxylesterase [Agromyces flavus]GGI48241.1 phospholipase/carboxylesterase [Agromyces flavus]SDR74128.1 phospholipase/carboxylesterase [Agromyces flavus]
MRIDDEAVLWSASRADRAGRPLLVLLHGYGSHEGDLFGLSPYLPLRPAIASLRAPIAMGYGHSWFPLPEELDDELSTEDAETATTAVIEWLDRVAPDAASVGLLGFSQGGAMAIELLRRAPERFAFAVSLAGFALPGEREGDKRMSQLAIPVFWGRGTDDEVIPAAAIVQTQEWLPSHSDLDQRVYEGLGHSVSDRELADVSAFLRAQYAAA